MPIRRGVLPAALAVVVWALGVLWKRDPIAGLLPSLPVLEFATVTAIGVMAMVGWVAWRARHA